MARICNYCGCTDLDYEERCECGGKFVCSEGGMEFYSWEIDDVMVKCNNDLFYGGSNNIDNILELQRSKIKTRNK